MNVTVFSRADNPSGGKTFEASKVLALIKTGGKQRELILKIAEETDKKKRAEMKMGLPAICFNGEFTYRNISSFISHSGLMTVDIDNLLDLDGARKSIEALPYVYSCFLSPSYNGLKVLVKIPTINVSELGSQESDFKFKEYFTGIVLDWEESIGIKIDPSGKDTSRVCFASYDPNIYINENATVFDKKGTVERPSNYVEFIDIKYSGASDQWCLDKLSEKVSSSADGERHHELYNASRLAGGFISANRISETDAVYALQSAFNQRPFDESYKYKKTITDGIKDGLHYPIYEDEKFKNENKTMTKTKVEQPYSIHPQLIDEQRDGGISVKTAADVMYVEFDEFEEDANEMFENGNRKGLECRFPIGRDMMSYKIGFSTFIYSAPFSGKTQFAMSELEYLAKRYGWNIAVYSKEIGEPKDVLAEVSSIHIGKLYTHKDPNLKMSKSQKDKAHKFFKEHFHVIDPMFKKQDIDVTAEAIFHCVKDIEAKKGIHIDCVYIDPLSEVDEGGEDRMDRFVKRVNKLVNDDARINGRHNFLVSHVRDQQPILDKDSGTTWFPLPTPREIAGGQNSFKQGYQMICIYRPSPYRTDRETGAEYAKNETHVVIQKAKPKGVGFEGMYKLYYDWMTNRYYQDKQLTDYHPKEQPDEQEQQHNFWDNKYDDIF